ncbi:hypothetical protein [Photobacterium kishitanii]|uniref:hypothetical protein n=1 Tax=Photobacterium kishitanii TaxID=318456 RepID=UPI00071AEF8F|nr:hypothetical protein [Photobacterium kishitanii]
MEENAQKFKTLFSWIHSVFAAISVTFFLALLSAGNNTINSPEIVLASVFFCISLPLNSCLSFFMLFVGENEELINNIYPHGPMWGLQKTIPTIAWYSFLLGIFFLISFYSYWFAFLSAGAFVYTFSYLKNTIVNALIFSLKTKN